MNEARMIDPPRPVKLDPRTPEGRKALRWLTVPTRDLLNLLGLCGNRPFYSKAELCLMCVERGLKRPLV